MQAFFRKLVRRIRPPDRVNLIEQAIAAIRLAGDRLVYVDIGAAGGIPPAYTKLSRAGHAQLVLVDPQEDWRSSIPTAEYAGADLLSIKEALAGFAGERTLYLTAAPGCSSLLPPNRAFLKRYPVSAWFAIVAQQQIAVTTFAAVQQKYQIAAPDIVKLDVQGAELEVLSGFGAALDQVSFIELEVCMESMYVGQPTLSEVYAFMGAKGFCLRDLKPQGPFEGEAVEFNALWSRPVSHQTPRQARLESFWKLTHGAWPGEFFADADRQARRYVKFSQPPP